MVVTGGVAVSYERGTVVDRFQEKREQLETFQEILRGHPRHFDHGKGCQGFYLKAKARIWP